MELKGIILATENTNSKMAKRGKKKNEEPTGGLPQDLTAEQLSYIQALEAELSEQRQRVLLYRGVIQTASESLGVDILKKIGGQPSGP
jgi:hypothetical protein